MAGRPHTEKSIRTYRLEVTLGTKKLHIHFYSTSHWSTFVFEILENTDNCWCDRLQIFMAPAALQYYKLNTIGAVIEIIIFHNACLTCVSCLNFLDLVGKDLQYSEKSLIFAQPAQGPAVCAWRSSVGNFLNSSMENLKSKFAHAKSLSRLLLLV